MLNRAALPAKIAAGLVTAVLAGWTLPASAGAVSVHPDIKGTGSFRCAATGKVKFTPPLTTGGTSSTAVKVVATLSACSGSGSGATVTGGRVAGTITGTPAGDCTVTQMSTSGTLTVTYTVKSGSPLLKPTVVSFNTVQAFTGPPVTAQIDGAATSGSFVGDGSFLNVTLNQSSPCVAKWTYSASGSTYEMG